MGGAVTTETDDDEDEDDDEDGTDPMDGIDQVDRIDGEALGDGRRDAQELVQVWSSAGLSRGSVTERRRASGPMG